MKILSDEFLNKYKHIEPPMTELGRFVYYRTYSRWLPDKQRRETWLETVARAVDYNVSLELRYRPEADMRAEAEELFDNIFNLRQFLSGRSLWVGGTPVADKFPLSLFNCAFLVLDSFEDFADLFYLLMIGSGTGFRALPRDVEALDRYRSDVSLEHLPYNGKRSLDREDLTSLIIEGEAATIVVGDSKEGWIAALDIYFMLLTNYLYRDVKTIKINFDSVRPKGERLKTFGGSASGHESLKRMFEKIHNVMVRAGGKLQSVDVLDIANIIGENVVVGGVRRTSEIGIFSPDDTEIIQAKSQVFTQNEDGNWVPNEELLHRTMSNNSLWFDEKPSREKLHEIFQGLKTTGEPGFINGEGLRRRRADGKGINPCGEVLLDDKQTCNLVTNNVMAFVTDDGGLDREGLYRAFELSARSAFRMTLVDLEISDWDKQQKKDRLTGVSLTGWQDMVSATGMSASDQAELLRELRKVVRAAVDSYADELGVNRTLLATVLKPEGCCTPDHIRTLDNGILFVDELCPTIQSESTGFYDIPTVYTRGGNLVSRVYKNDVKDVVKLVLKNGRELKVTPQHPVSVGGEWVEARNVKIGDVLDYKLGTYRNERHTPLIDVGVDELRPDVRDYKMPKELNEDIAWLIGAYMANGCFTTNDRIKFHCGNHDVHLKVQRIWKEYFGVETNIIKSSDRDSYVQDFGSAKIQKWISANGMDKCDENGEMVRIPLPIRQSSYKDIIAFLVGYADNDGCFHSDSFCIDSANEAWIRHLQEVAEAVGICFGLSVNVNSFSKNPIYKLYFYRSFSNPEVVPIINALSIKAKASPVTVGQIQGRNPFTVVEIETLLQQETYDIEVDQEHWYYQGGIKSHNTLSQLPTVSSGVHYSHSPYYIRRVRINSHDPLVKVAEDLGWPIYPEVGQEWETCSTNVIEFPVKSPSKRTKYQVSAIEQLENYKMFMENYVEHNVSITVTVRDHEWEEVEQWVWDHWDDIVAISFLALDEHVYPLAPYEAIDREEYERRLRSMRPFDPSLLVKYEVGDDFDIESMDGCDAGVCPIR